MNKKKPCLISFRTTCDIQDELEFIAEWHGWSVSRLVDWLVRIGLEVVNE